METTKTFTISILGEASAKPYNGQFTVKTTLTRAERFAADVRRREILGPNGGEAAVELQLEAAMLGQLAVRVVSGPAWWEQSDRGLKLEDLNVLVEIYNLTRAKEEEAAEELKKQAEEALSQISKK